MSKYCLNRNFKVIYIEFGYQMGGSQNADQFIKQMEESGFLSDYEYGKDYVHLGWQPGWETGVSQVGNDFQNGIQTNDFYGNPTAGMEILEGIVTAADTDFWFVLTSYGSDGLEIYLRQILVTHGTDLALAPVAYYVTMFQPYYSSGQIKGFMPSIGAGGEFEFLSGFPGKGLASTDIMSMTHIMFVLFLIAGNVVYLSKRNTEGDK
jgi:hypothetical protein